MVTESRHRQERHRTTERQLSTPPAVINFKLVLTYPSILHESSVPLASNSLFLAADVKQARGRGLKVPGERGRKREKMVLLKLARDLALFPAKVEDKANTMSIGSVVGRTSLRDEGARHPLLGSVGMTTACHCGCFCG